MPGTIHRRRLFRLLCAATVFLCGKLTAVAQTSAPDGAALSDQVARLGDRASQLLPYLQHEVLSPIEQWMFGIAAAVAVLVCSLSFLRQWRENAGGNHNLVFFFIRTIFFFSLLGSSVWIVSQMAAVGREIAEGGELPGGGGLSLLVHFYQDQRAAFDASYEKLTMALFTVMVDERDFSIRTSNPTGSTFIGVGNDTEGALKSVEREYDDSSHSLPALYNWLSISRLFLEAGDFWLLLLGGVLVLVCKTVAPLMVALAIDQKLARKITYPFAWGVGVLTLVWPAVSYFIRGLAYLVGNLAMAMGDGGPTYRWDYATMSAVKSDFASPVHVVVFASFIMVAAGVSLGISPYFVYRFFTGKVYEGVSTAMSHCTGMVVSAGAGPYLTDTVVSVNRTARSVQTRGSHDVQTIDGEIIEETGMLTNQATFMAGRAAALATSQANAGLLTAAPRGRETYLQASFAENDERI